MTAVPDCADSASEGVLNRGVTCIADMNPAIHFSVDTQSFNNPILFMADSCDVQRHALQTEILLSVLLLLLLLRLLLFDTFLHCLYPGLGCLVLA